MITLVRIDKVSFNAEVLRVLIASPSDVQEERDEIEKAIFEWNTKYAEQLKTILLPSRWENDVIPSYKGINAQEIINEQLVNKCDILIGVFWTKLGTPTLNHSSGTLEEINIFIEQGKEIMLYFLDNPLPRNTDFDEVKKVDMYKDDYGKKGIYATYNIHKIVDHLYKRVVNYQKDNVDSIKTSKDSNSISVERLILSGKLTQSEILFLGYIQDTGNRQFGDRWLSEATTEMIKTWEYRYSITSDLLLNYDGVINNFSERGLIEAKEYTNQGNPRLYVMPLEIYDQLRGLSELAVNEIKVTINSLSLPF